VLSFTGNSVVSLGTSRWPAQRRLLIALWYGTVVGALVAFGLLTFPSIFREGAELLGRLQNENPYVLVAGKLRAIVGEPLSSRLEALLALAQAGGQQAPQPSAEALVHLASRLEGGAAAGAGGEAAAAERLGRVLAGAVQPRAAAAVQLASAGLATAGRGALQGLLSVVLSFVILWDLPAIRAGLGSLRASRLGWAYSELAPPLASFAVLFGKALQAQFLVAVVNTALTAAGMLFLQLPGVAFLAAIVFFFSFIPVAGVIISTVPIGFVALTEFGFARLLAVIVMVALAHAVEAYLLNPAIYSAHLKLHPLIVLVVLVLAEHSLGVWGLLLAVPFTVFLVALNKTPAQREAEALRGASAESH